ncbi:hypothetical protein [Methylobrevis pamukkalensis]|uniref:Outer membrane protein beta-barrel domain-containing protein n=1 Tax=Methylobrevis pamukkalensis TaxID=1439726 RepID=A0A1E3H810_9HYPH|nr:hypothetical protein A6302_00199 [Methylobrevis pamukkalensis]
MFAGGFYGFSDGEDLWEANGGVGYTISEGLTLAGEVKYIDEGEDDGNFNAILGLIRTW